MSLSDPPPMLRAAREPRSVGIDRAFAWYSEAMRLFKRHPLGFAGIAVAVVAGDLLLNLVPAIGPPAANVLVPLFACSLLYASLACDRDDRPRLEHLVAPFAAPVGAVGAVIAASLAVFGAEWLVAWKLAGINLLEMQEVRDLGAATLLSIYGAGVAVSLPLTLVPLLAMFEGASAREAFVASAAAFARNVPAFLLYGALSIALLGLAFVTLGLGLLIVLPLWAASSYAAWKDLFGVT